MKLLQVSVNIDSDFRDGLLVFEILRVFGTQLSFALQRGYASFEPASVCEVFFILLENGF